MKEFAWKVLAKIVSKPRVAEAIIRYAKRTPYLHLPSNEDPCYMERYWVFNPYSRVTHKPRWGWLCPISIRVHHIKREDLDRALHDHPWNARTIILDGWYVEERLAVLPCDPLDEGAQSNYGYNGTNGYSRLGTKTILRTSGDTASLRFASASTTPSSRSARVASTPCFSAANGAVFGASSLTVSRCHGGNISASSDVPFLYQAPFEGLFICSRSAT